jgi:hypothetical protein
MKNKSIVLFLLTIFTAGTLSSIQAANTDNPKPVTVTNFPVSQNVNGAVTINNLPTTQQVNGQVSISNLPQVQGVEVKKTLIRGGGEINVPINEKAELVVPAGIVLTDIIWTPSTYAEMMLNVLADSLLVYNVITSSPAESKVLNLSSGIKGPVTIRVSAPSEIPGSGTRRS